MVHIIEVSYCRFVSLTRFKAIFRVLYVLSTWKDKQTFLDLWFFAIYSKPWHLHNRHFLKQFSIIWTNLCMTVRFRFCRSVNHCSIRCRVLIQMHVASSGKPTLAPEFPNTRNLLILDSCLDVYFLRHIFNLSLIDCSAPEVDHHSFIFCDSSCINLLPRRHCLRLPISCK